MPPPPPPRTQSELRRPELFVNRELSWLEFNRRVLEEAQDESVPLLERLKFLGIVASNLDEFFMVRVAGLLRQRAGDVEEPFDDGLGPAQQLVRIAEVTHALVRDQYRCLQESVRPALRARGLAYVETSELTVEDRAFLAAHFERQVQPVLTPLLVDPGHPFPHLRNRSLNLAALLADPRHEEPMLALVQVPGVLGRTIELPGPGRRIVLLEELLRIHFAELFPQLPVLSCIPFRVTRNWDLNLDEEEADDLLRHIQEELRKRDRGATVRLELAAGAPAIKEKLARALGVSAQETFELDGPIDMATIARAFDAEPARDLRDEPFVPVVAPSLRDTDLFAEVTKNDLLLHHPYESFETVVRFVEQAAEDPAVLAIKMTLYRTGGDSPLIRALARAAENGKQVTAIVELKARFDEALNIAWARRLEESGVHVVYGLIGLKTHAKLLLVVRREGEGPARYAHIGTGNYNPGTSRFYTDLSLLTRRPELAEDVAKLFNLLTGGGAPPRLKRLAVSPLDMLKRVKGLIQRETEHARAGRPGRIRAKMNSLVDGEIIATLYEASQAGVEIDLIVRGICCLRPGIPGISERIRVRSIVDRFLEHARLFAFDNGGETELYLSSADWMPRNLRRRVEVMAPVLDPVLRERLLAEVLGVALKDDVKARLLQSDGAYVRAVRVENVRSQAKFMSIARASVVEEEEDPTKRALQYFLVAKPPDEPR